MTEQTKDDCTEEKTKSKVEKKNIQIEVTIQKGTKYQPKTLTTKQRLRPRKLCDLIYKVVTLYNYKTN